MNTRLVESLAEAVNSLPSDDYAMFQLALMTKTIQKTSGVCGGHARIRNTRIAVWTLISLMKQEMDEDMLTNEFPGLTHFDVLAARTYYRANPEEIDDLIVSHHEQDWNV
ncbi:MAG: DUF433 domain-containing protein [Synechococcaceae cyanobacterium SM2_3_1]|nr:DUF433 domain-containing protein [Synechococcaceae cyanobacterium SM2_3_1]